MHMTYESLNEITETMHMTYESLIEITGGFSEQIGCGTFAVVYKVCLPSRQNAGSPLVSSNKSSTLHTATW
jgi:hypothetical protein